MTFKHYKVSERRHIFMRFKLFFVANFISIICNFVPNFVFIRASGQNVAPF